jgi:hypothetical protein
MNKIIVIVMFLLSSIFSASAVECGMRKQLVVVPKSQPVSFSHYVDSGTGFLVKVTSQKEFVIGEPFEEYFKDDKMEYLLKISQMGKVEFTYSLDTPLPVKVLGRYEYRTVGDQDCPQSKSISQWRFIKESTQQ